MSSWALVDITAVTSTFSRAAWMVACPLDLHLAYAVPFLLKFRLGESLFGWRWCWPSPAICPDAVIQWAQVQRLQWPNCLPPMHGHVEVQELLGGVSGVCKCTVLLEHKISLRIHGRLQGYYMLAKYVPPGWTLRWPFAIQHKNHW